MALSDVNSWWEDHQGEAWDPERAAQPGSGGQPSDYNLFGDLLMLQDPELVAGVGEEARRGAGA